jgi:hypothetical protein
LIWFSDSGLLALKQAVRLSSILLIANGAVLGIGWLVPDSPLRFSLSARYSPSIHFTADSSSADGAGRLPLGDPPKNTAYAAQPIQPSGGGMVLRVFGHCQL